MCAPCVGVAVQVTLWMPAVETSFVATTASTAHPASSCELMTVNPLFGNAVTEAAPKSPTQTATRSGRTRGRDIQAGLRWDGYLVPLSVLNHAAVFDLDCRECDLIWSGHGRGYDMPVAAYSREGGVQCFTGIRPQQQRIIRTDPNHAVCVAFVIRRQRRRCECAFFFPCQPMSISCFRRLG